VLLLVLDETSPARVGALVLGLLAFGGALAAPILYRRWLITLIDPDEELRARVLRLSWLSANLSVGELLDHSVAPSQRPKHPNIPTS
jgi:hypothetical protein